MRRRDSGGVSVAEYPIDSTVVRTTERILSFPMPAQPAGPDSGAGLYLSELHLIQEYGKYGYGDWQFSAEGLQIKQRFDIMPDPAGYSVIAASLTRLQQFANFFTITDIHITDKEAPNQLIYLQQAGPDLLRGKYFHLLAGHDVYNPCPRRRHSDGKRPAQEKSL